MKSIRGLRGLAACLLLSLAVGNVAQAAESPRRADVLTRLLDCRKVEDAAARLACYDAAAGAMDEAEAKGDVVVVDREQARTVRRQGFGFNLPSLSLFERGEKADEVEKLQLKVVAARQDGYGKWTVVLEGDQVWRQIDTGDFSLRPKPGMVATIRRAMLGSYIMSIGGRAGVRMHRDK
jgi:hypothetical protein